MNKELPDVQGGFRKGRGTRDQIGNICWVIEKAREFQKKKKSTYCLLTTAKPLIVCLSQTVGNSSRDGNIRPPYLPPGVANGQEATVRTGHGKIDCLQIEKGICQLDIVTVHI